MRSIPDLTYKTFYVGDKCYDKNLLNSINDVLNDCWGTFPLEFLEKHISESYVALGYVDEDLVGLSFVKTKKIAGKKVCYVEFTAVKKEYQRMSLGLLLTIKAIKKCIMSNLLSIFTFELMFITPNIRVICLLKRYATFVYPDPSKFDISKKRLPIADDRTWKMAKTLISHSDNPNRKLDREALVLHGSYKETPWLLYNDDTIPWLDNNAQFNSFVEHYLGYSSRQDREFIVRAKFSILSIVKEIFKHG